MGLLHAMACAPPPRCQRQCRHAAALPNAALQMAHMSSVSTLFWDRHIEAGQTAFRYIFGHTKTPRPAASCHVNQQSCFQRCVMPLASLSGQNLHFDCRLCEISPSTAGLQPHRVYQWHSMHKVYLADAFFVQAAAADDPLPLRRLRALHRFLGGDVAAGATDGGELEQPQLPRGDEVVQVAVPAVAARNPHAQAPAPARGAETLQIHEKSTQVAEEATAFEQW